MQLIKIIEKRYLFWLFFQSSLLVLLQVIFVKILPGESIGRNAGRKSDEKVP